ncbi:MAG: polymorphic toxin type 8 domain-containing protein [Rickettsiaceae bacterium]|nr:polymorphic toxin type 8 domain-containing protein [Rickettsiaceae bacterium]
MNFLKPLAVAAVTSCINSVLNVLSTSKFLHAPIPVNKNTQASRSHSTSVIDSIDKTCATKDKKINKFSNFGVISNLIKITELDFLQKYDEDRVNIDVITQNKKDGRRHKQKRLRQLMNDDKVASCDRGWIKQDYHQIQRGTRKSIRIPPGKHLSHWRGFEAQKGYSYLYSSLQDIKLHKLQHKFDGYGAKNIDRGKTCKVQELENSTIKQKPIKVRKNRSK